MSEIITVRDAALAPPLPTSPIYAPSYETAVQRRDEFVRFVKDILQGPVYDKDGKLIKEGIDYGIVPGVAKPSLLKPGAEKLLNFFGYEPHFETVEKVSRWEEGNEFFLFHYRCIIKNSIGKVVGVCEGSCNSHETKYRYRWVTEDAVPDYLPKTKLRKRGGPTSITVPDWKLRKRETTGRYGKPEELWAAFERAIADGTAQRGEQAGNRGPELTWTITANVVEYRIPNPDLANEYNPIMKIAQKRAFIGAVLMATGASEFFTQDVEDMELIGDRAEIKTDPKPEQKAEDKKPEPKKKEPAEADEPKPELKPLLKPAIATGKEPRLQFKHLSVEETKWILRAFESNGRKTQAQIAAIIGNFAASAKAETLEWVYQGAVRRDPTTPPVPKENEVAA